MEHARSPKKVFGIGLSRTGTTSLTVALRMLGFKSIHWPHDHITQRELTAYHSGRAAFRFSIAETFDAVTDTPVASVYRELSHIYPDSRFVLTVRDRVSWLESCANFFKRSIRSEETSFGYPRYCATIHRKLYGRTDFDPSDFEAAYSRHVAGITRWFEPTPRRLLVMDITAGDGWKKLCDLLGAEDPHKPFPHKNREWFSKRHCEVLTARIYNHFRIGVCTQWWPEPSHNGKRTDPPRAKAAKQEIAQKGNDL